MEHDFENNIEGKKLGGGIITLAVITFVFSAIGIVSSIITLLNLDNVNKTLESLGSVPISSTTLIISLIVSIIGVLGFILILLWKKIGIYLYYASIVLSLITTFINTKDFSAFTILGFVISLIIPVLLAIFLKNKFKFFT